MDLVPAGRRSRPKLAEIWTCLAQIGRVSAKLGPNLSKLGQTWQHRPSLVEAAAGGRKSPQKCAWEHSSGICQAFSKRLCRVPSGGEEYGVGHMSGMCSLRRARTAGVSFLLMLCMLEMVRVGVLPSDKPTTPRDQRGIREGPHQEKNASISRRPHPWTFLIPIPSAPPIRRPEPRGRRVT